MIDDIELPKRIDEVSEPPALDSAAPTQETPVSIIDSTPVVPAEPVAEIKTEEPISAPIIEPAPVPSPESMADVVGMPVLEPAVEPVLEAPIEVALETPISDLSQITPAATNIVTTELSTELTNVFNENPASDNGSLESMSISEAPIQEIVGGMPPLEESAAITESVTETIETVPTSEPLEQTVPPAETLLEIETEAIPESNEPLGKKLVVEKPVKQPKEKGKGNPVVGFFALLLILGAIVTALYYFVKIDIIKLPEGINLPFLEKKTTPPANNNGESQTSQTINVVGSYMETANSICPDEPITLTLKDDSSFVYNELTLDARTNKCETNEITGVYVAFSGTLTLSSQTEDVINGTYKDENGMIVITITTKDNKEIEVFQFGA